MFFNTFFGARLRRIVSQLIIIFILIFISIYLIQNKKKSLNKNKSEVIYEKDNFSEILLENRKKISAPSIKIKVKYGDTLEKILKNNDFNNADIFDAIRETKTIFNPKNLVNGQMITIKYKLNNKKEKKIESINLPLEFNKEFLLENNQGQFTAKIISQKTIDRIVKRKGFITDSLYNSALRSGIDIKTITEMIRIFSFSVDFQRDIWPKDSFEILYEEELLKYDKSKKESGNILYANLVLKSGISLKLYRFKTKDGKIDYFDETGKSAQKLLMKTPLDGARISSGFGMRKHPILGYNIAHRGVDFAASKGTPVYAAGDGSIEIKKYHKINGKYIVIRHVNGFKTFYLHLSKFAKTSGRVKQGQTIGYVGSTGRSTAPHLHYEIHKNNKKINPQTLKLPSGKKLKDKELENFIEEKNKIERQLDTFDFY